MPPVPPLFPKLPHDLFYPFNLGESVTSSARSAASLAPIVGSLVVAVAALLAAAANL